MEHTKSTGNDLTLRYFQFVLSFYICRQLVGRRRKIYFCIYLARLHIIKFQITLNFNDAVNTIRTDVARAIRLN